MTGHEFPDVEETKIRKTGLLMQIKSRIRTIAHYPHEGIMFRDITTLLKDPVGLRAAIQEIAARHKNVKIDKVAGIESRGFIIGAPVALMLGIALCQYEKKATAAAETRGRIINWNTGAIASRFMWMRFRKAIVCCSWLISLRRRNSRGSAKLIEEMVGEVVECCLVIDLPDIGAGRVGNQGLEGICSMRV